MAVETKDKKETKIVRHGNPMSPESLAEYEKVWTDMEECIAYCNKHPAKLDKRKK